MGAAASPPPPLRFGRTLLTMRSFVDVVSPVEHEEKKKWNAKEANTYVGEKHTRDKEKRLTQVSSRQSTQAMEIGWEHGE